MAVTRRARSRSKLKGTIERGKVVEVLEQRHTFFRVHPCIRVHPLYHDTTRVELDGSTKPLRILALTRRSSDFSILK